MALDLKTIQSLFLNLVQIFKTFKLTKFGLHSNKNLLKKIFFSLIK